MDAPERIWLLPHDGEQRCWCDDPAPGLDMNPSEADEYVRADALAAKDAEIERLRARIAEMDEALHPFSEIAGEMFARNWELGRVVVALDNPDGANRVLFDDFLRARKALEG